jgi:hypothetical protein
MCYEKEIGQATVTPAIDPIDIVINSALNVLDLRDITLARAENEVGREIVRGFPWQVAMCLTSKQKRSIKRDPSDSANL